MDASEEWRPPRLDLDTAVATSEDAHLYPQSQPSSEPCSPTSMDRSAASDVSSPNYIAGQRLCWNSSTPSPFANDDDPQQLLGAAAAAAASLAASSGYCDFEPQNDQPRLLGAAAAAAASLAASVAGGDLDSWEGSGEVEEVHIRTAMPEAGGPLDLSNQAMGLSDFSCGQVPDSPTTNSFEPVPSSEEAYVMTYGDYKQLWPMNGLSLSRENEEALNMGRDLDADMVGQGPNSRACDEMLRPVGGGQPFVVRGAEALAEAQRLAALNASSFGEDAHYSIGGSSSSSVGNREDEPHSIDIGDHSAGNSEDTVNPQELEECRPTAADLRQGLSVLRALSMEIEEERRSRDKCTNQGLGTSETQELRSELQEGQAECRGLREQIAYAEDVERRYAATVKELRAELHVERQRLQAETEMATVAERAAVAAVEREANLHITVREEVIRELRDACFADARAEAAAENQRLEAALSVAAGQEAAANAVATELRAALLAGQCGDEVESQDAGRVAALEAALTSARSREAEESSVAAQLLAACKGLQQELQSETAAAKAARQAAPNTEEEDGRDSATLALYAARREHEMQAALTASEHQRQLDEARQEAEKQQLLARIELLSRELEIERQGSADHRLRLQDAESDATTLKMENRRLHAELLSEFSAATAAAVEASAAATAAVSSVAALEERSRATPIPGYSIASLDSTPPPIPPLARRLLQDPESLSTTPVFMRSAAETPAFLGSQQTLTSTTASGEFGSEYQDRTPPRRRGAIPQKPLRLPNAGDVAAGEAVGRALAKPLGESEAAWSVQAALTDKDVDRQDVGQQEASAENADDAFGSLSTPFRGGPLGLARALAMRSGASRSKSPLRRR